MAEWSWKINDAHHMFWIFSSWCVKGELGLWDSRLGLPEGEAAERQKRLKDSSDIHLMLQCLSLVWTVKGGGGGSQISSKHTDRSITYEQYFVNLFKNIYLLICVIWLRCNTVQEIILTSDLPNGAEHVEFFRVQSFYFVIYISVNKNGSSVRHKHKT